MAVRAVLLLLYGRPRRKYWQVIEFYAARALRGVEFHLADEGPQEPSLLGQSPDDTKREMFLAFIDTFTVWHLKALVFLRHPDGWISRHGLGVQDNLILRSAEAALYTVFPELYREPDFRLTLIQELRSRSLIKPDDSSFEFATADGGKGMDATTRLGREFIDFVSDPEKTNR